MKVMSASSVKPGIFGNAPRPLLNTMNNEFTPSFSSLSAYSLGIVIMYCFFPSGFFNIVILCSIIFGIKPLHHEVDYSAIDIYTLWGRSLYHRKTKLYERDKKTKSPITRK